MKKFFKVLIILIIVGLLAVDFVGLWKYKLSGTNYVIQTAADDAAGDASDVGGADAIEYEEITSTSLTALDKLFIKTIEQNEDGKYSIKGLVVRPVEIEKEEYSKLRAGKETEILGVVYTQKQIKSNNLILKSEDENAKNYYIKYDNISKKYVLKDMDNDATVYEKTDKYVSMEVDKDFSFITDKNGKTTKSSVADVIDSHKDIDVPEEATSKLNVCVLAFDKNGSCTKITEYCI